MLSILTPIRLSSFDVEINGWLGSSNLGFSGVYFVYIGAMQIIGPWFNLKAHEGRGGFYKMLFIDSPS